MIDHKELLEFLHYDPETGMFHKWKKDKSGEKILGRNIGSTNANGYVYISYKGKLYSGVRIAWFYYYGHWPKGYIRYKNGDPGDLSRANLKAIDYEDEVRSIISRKKMIGTDRIKIIEDDLNIFEAKSN